MGDMIDSVTGGMVGAVCELRDDRQACSRELMESIGELRQFAPSRDA